MDEDPLPHTSSLAASLLNSAFQTKINRREKDVYRFGALSFPIYSVELVKYANSLATH